MSSFQQHTMLTTLSSNFDERQWVKQIIQTLEEQIEEEEENEHPVTIFAVPKSIMLTKPDSYIPQQVAIGPYHHLRLELYDMERYKIAAAKRNQKGFKLKTLVDQLIKHELQIRAKYHRPLSFYGETLAWMIVVDASFLLEFLEVCAVKEGKVLTRIPSKSMSHLIDLSGNKNSHNCILRDVIMVENQIPLFAMRFLLEFQFSSIEAADEMLLSMLIGLSKELSPFQMVEFSNKVEVKDCAHLLDFLYLFVVPKVEADSDEAIEVLEEEGEGKVDEESVSRLRRILDELWSVLSKLEQGPVQWIKKVIFSKPVRAVVTLPWTLLAKIPILKMLKTPIEQTFKVFNKDKEKNEDEESGSGTNNPPLLEEIEIPSVCQLRDAGVIFSPTNEGIAGIEFDVKSLVFRIPIIKLDVNSEVVMRNLVAYEACSASGPLVLTRYTELMNGIIDTDEDVKFLCQKGIIINQLKSEKEVVNIWNGMSKSIRLTKVPSLDKVIGDVNKYYDGRLKVRFEKFMKDYVFGSWRILTFFAGVMLLLLMSLQAFCQVYSCGRLVRIKGLEPANN